MRNKVLALFVLCLLMGCAKIQHLEQLLTLKDYSENGAEKDKFVEEHYANFEHLLKVIADGTLEEHRDKNKILEVFGEPGFKKAIVREGENLDRWVYRYEVKAFDSEKVYLYFDKKDVLVDWEHIMPRDRKND